MCGNIICSEALSKGSGLLKDLEQKISEDEVRNLELLGYIENALVPQGETRKFTRKGEKNQKINDGQKNSYRFHHGLDIYSDLEV
jgi:hypothetical protein